AGADAVRGEQRVHRATGSHLPLPERAGDIRPADRAPLLDLREQMAERGLYPGDDAYAELALDRARVRGDARHHRLDHLLGGLVEDRAEHVDGRRIELTPRIVVNLYSIGIT